MAWGWEQGLVPSFLPSRVVSALGLVIFLSGVPSASQVAFHWHTRSALGYRKSMGLESKRPGFKSGSATCSLDKSLHPAGYYGPHSVVIS